MPIDISIDKQRGLFKKHLDEKGNDRVIFSGPFGIGKTYFLNNFFDKREEEYLAIKLAPINYSVSSNEDIFKLIKYDILVECVVTHGLQLVQREPISKDVALGTLLPSRLEPIATALLPILPLLNKSADDIPILFAALTSLSEIIKDVEKQRKETSLPGEPISFGEEMIKKYLLETDEVTNFLEQSLTELASKKKAKYKVLVIDDLDRIDPEHIFRLFNIFSAHLDYNGSTSNKFGFDKVVFVCDVHNIRNIFHTRYGTETDFTGYIDKFFSQEIFYFNNKEEVKNTVDKFIKSIRTNDKYYHYFGPNILNDRNYQERSMLSVVLTELILSGALRMRRFANSEGVFLEMPDEIIDIPNGRNVAIWKIPAIITIRLLARIMGGGQALERGIHIVSEYRKSLDYQEDSFNRKSLLIGYLLPIADYENHKLKPHTLIQDFIRNGEVAIRYTLIESGPRQDIYFAEVRDNLKNIDFFTVLLDTIKVMLRDELLKA